MYYMHIGYQPLGIDWHNKNLYMASRVRDMASPYFDKFCSFAHNSFRLDFSSMKGIKVINYMIYIGYQPIQSHRYIHNCSMSSFFQRSGLPTIWRMYFYCIFQNEVVLPYLIKSY